MTDPKPKPTNGLLGRLERYLIYVVIVVIGGITIPPSVSPNARPDAYPAARAATDQALLREQMEVIRRDLEMLIGKFNGHLSLGMHAGAATNFAGLHADVRYIKEAIGRIERKVDSKNGD